MEPSVWVVPFPDEPTHGMMMRLAQVNGFPRLRAFETLVGVRTHEVRMGEKLNVLAGVLRCDPADLQERCYRRLGEKTRSFRGMTFGEKKDIEGRSRRVCPGCLAEAAYHRFWWDFTFIRFCPAHERRLVEVCSCGQALTWDDVAPDKCRHCEDGSVHGLPPEPGAPDAVALDRFLMAKLGVGEADAVPVLADLSPQDAFEVAGRVGALDARGYARNWVEAADLPDPDGVRSRGLRILADGLFPALLDRVFREFMDQRETSDRTTKPRIDTAYGWFTHWFRFKGDEEFSPALARMIIAHAETKFHVTATTYPNTPRSGEALNLNEAAALCRCRHGTLRRLLAKEGLIRPERIKGSPIRIARSVVERFAADLKDSANLEDLVEITGLGIVSVRKLVREGVIPCWLKGGGVEAHRFLFRRRDVVAWMESVIPEAPIIDRTEGMLTLADYSLERKVGVVDMIGMLESGEIEVVGRLEGGTSFAGSMVDKRRGGASAGPRRAATHATESTGGI